MVEFVESLGEACGAYAFDSSLELVESGGVFEGEGVDDWEGPHFEEFIPGAVDGLAFVELLLVQTSRLTQVGNTY